MCEPCNAILKRTFNKPRYYPSFLLSKRLIDLLLFSLLNDTSPDGGYSLHSLIHTSLSFFHISCLNMPPLLSLQHFLTLIPFSHPASIGASERS